MTATTIHIPTLQTERLSLRAPGPQDVAPFAAFFASDPSRPIGGPLDLAQSWRLLAGIIGHWGLRGYGRWIVTWKGSDAAIGLVGLHHPQDWPEVEIGWTVWGDGLGKGVAQEASRRARSHGFETLGLSTLISSCAPDNPRSAKVAERLGAVRDGAWTHPEYGPFDIWRHPKTAP
ncbi:GNAT family N-acetyltransferase [Boseongicola sp. H5]|uniref:GNAT family N-acetyltransferase n=1 Tax=Rhodobacterales TaxID=204455 RepID=UPI001D0AF8C4|nr:GNAT family N-acetyltransferase [Boseongicola sp. H5]